jgi:hypothetical protein
LNATRALLKFLKDEGYRPTLQRREDGSTAGLIRFKAEGKTFLAIVDDDDPAFFHVELGYSFPDDADVPLLLSAANDLNQNMKVVKAVVDVTHRVVEFHVELFVGEVGPTAGILQRSLRVLALAANEFFERRCKAPVLNA